MPFRRKYGKYRRSRSMSRGRRVFKAGYRKAYGVRSKSARRRGKGSKKVTVRMLKQIVGRPEVKVHTYMNGGLAATPSNWTESTIWIDGFKIPSGSSYQNRVGNKIKLVRIVAHFETMINSPIKTDLLVSGGAAGTANTIATIEHDQEIKLLVLDDGMNTSTGVSRSGLQYKGYSSAQSNAPGGASDFWADLDFSAFRSQGRRLRMLRTFRHCKGTAIYGTPTAPSTVGGPCGMPRPASAVKEHWFTVSFGPTGKILEYPSSSTSVPIDQPVLWKVGRNNLQTNNPYIRWTKIMIYYTDV